ncbi:tape measure protein [Pseudomonas sp. NPDC086581]|uniref:tape measure protein n=1 Tax=Pseudomonas sp. NPDC086581 TaxID=3364432 RepID=UPI0037F86780
MSGQLLRALVVKVSAETSAYQREMAKAGRLGDRYLRNIADGNRAAVPGWRAHQAAIEAQNRALESVTAGVGGYARAMAGALAVGSLVSLADDWGQVNSRLKMVTGSHEELVAVQDKLMEISDRTFKKYGDQADLFINSSKQMREMGFATEQTVAFVDVLASGLTVSATNAEGTASTIKAVSDAISIGSLKGDQWNTVLTRAPAIVEAIGDALGKTQAELGNMARKGELVTSVWLPALISKQDELARKTEEMPTTVADAFTRLGNHFQKWVGDENEATGATNALAQAIVFVSNNLDTLMKLAMVGGLAYLTRQAVMSGKALVEQAGAIRESISAEVGRRAAQMDITAQLARKAAAEVIAAEAQVAATVGTHAHTAALSRLRLARLEDISATRAQTAAELAHSRASSMMGRAGAGLLGIMGGPVGLAVTVAATAASFLLFNDSADKTEKAVTDLTRPVSELREEWEKLSVSQARVRLDEMVSRQAEAQQKAAQALRDIRDAGNGPDKWGDQYSANSFARERAVIEFEMRVKGGEDIAKASQQLIDAVGPSEDLRRKINELALAYEEATKESSTTGNLAQTLRDRLNDVGAAARNAGAGLATIAAPNLDAWNKRLEQMREQVQALQHPGAAAALDRQMAREGLESTPEGKQKAAELRATQQLLDLEEKRKQQREEGERRAKQATQDGERRIKQATEQAARGAKQLEEGFRRQRDSMAEQVALYGQTTTLAKLRYDLAHGELAALDGAKKIELERQAIALDALNARKEFDALMTNLQTSEEKALATARERLKVLQAANDAGTLKGGEYAAGAERISKATISRAPEYAGLDAVVGGAAGELQKVGKADKELEKWHEEQLAIQQKLLDDKLINEETYQKRLEELTAQHNTRLTDLGKARSQAEIGQRLEMFDAAVGLTEALVGNESGAYRAMFAASKAFHLAETIMAGSTAIAQAWASAPFPYNLGAVAAATVETGVLQAAVQSVGLAGMAHSGITDVPREGTWLLDRGERVVDANTNRDLKQFLRNKPEAANDSRPNVNIQINIDSEGQSSVQTPPGMEQFGQELAEFVDRRIRQMLMSEQGQNGLLDPNRRRG